MVRSVLEGKLLEPGVHEIVERVEGDVAAA